MQKTICYTKVSDWNPPATAVVRDGNNIDHWLFILNHVAVTRPVYGDIPGEVALPLEALPLPTTIIAYRPKEDPAAKYWDAENGMFRKADKVYLTAFNQDALFEGLRQKLGAYRLKLESTGISVALFPITDEMKATAQRDCGITTVAGYQCPCRGDTLLTEDFIREMLSSGKWLLK